MFIVSLPFAVEIGGYWAIAAMILVAQICCYTGKILVDCLYEIDLQTGRYEYHYKMIILHYSCVSFLSKLSYFSAINF